MISSPFGDRRRSYHPTLGPAVTDCRSVSPPLVRLPPFPFLLSSLSLILFLLLTCAFVSSVASPTTSIALSFFLPLSTAFLFPLRRLFLGHFESMLPKFTCMHAWVQHVLVCYAQAYLSITHLVCAVSPSPLDVLCLCFMRDPCQTFSFHSIHVQSCSTNHPCCLGQLTSNGKSFVGREISIIKRKHAQ